jgi:hypothetical protein
MTMTLVKCCTATGKSGPTMAQLKSGFVAQVRSPFDNRLRAELALQDGRVIMTGWKPDGRTSQHTLFAETTNTYRLRAHWRGFCMSY